MHCMMHPARLCGGFRTIFLVRACSRHSEYVCICVCVCMCEFINAGFIASDWAWFQEPMLGHIIGAAATGGGVPDAV